MVDDSSCLPQVVSAPLSQDLMALRLDEEAKASDAAESIAEIPSHRCHNPASNLKRSDPFMFGSRYLEAGDDVFEFNAWDHVETDDAYKEHAERQFELQRNSPVSDFDKSKLSVIYLSSKIAFGIMMIQISMHSSSDKT